MLAMTTILLAVAGALLLAGIAIVIVVRMSVRCPRCGSHKVIDNSNDARELCCLECGATWRETWRE